MKVILLTEDKSNQGELNILATFTGEAFVTLCLPDITVNKKGSVFYCQKLVNEITVQAEHSGELFIGGVTPFDGTWRCSFISSTLEQSLGLLTTIATTFEENDYGSHVTLNTLSRVVLA